MKYRERLRGISVVGSMLLSFAAVLVAKRSGQQIEEQNYLPGLAGHAEDIAPGKTATFEITLDAGTYELGCFILSTMGGQMMPRGKRAMPQVEHYDMGMHTLLSVLP